MELEVTPGIVVEEFKDNGGTKVQPSYQSVGGGSYKMITPF